MVRLSKKTRDRSVSPRRPRVSMEEKTGPRKDKLPKGFREHANAFSGEAASLTFISQVKRLHKGK